MIDEGYTKFACEWVKSPPLDDEEVRILNLWRRPLYNAGLVGHYKQANVGFGNISVRGDQPGQFLISGTQTGHLPDLTGEHYARVTDYDIDRNRVVCHGPVQASSESLTHAAIYELDPDIGAVVHAHSDVLWAALRNVAPTTHRDIAYGTADMAREFARLFRDTDFARSGIAVMAGHDAGLVSIGADLPHAARRMLALTDTLPESPHPH